MIDVIPDREKAIEIGCLALAKRGDFRSIVDKISAFDMYVLARGKPIGMLMTRGCEIHIAILPKYRRRWCTKEFIRQTIVERINTYGHVVTSVLADNPVGINFVERLGFKPTSQSNGVIYYRCESTIV